MKKFLSALSILVVLYSCNDGDIIVTSFDFEDADLQTCGGPGGYVFFKINPDAQESISLKLGTTDTLFRVSDTVVYQINGTTNIVNYRKYNGEITASYFCNSIPPTTPLVSIDYFGDSGTATLTTIATLDDNDGLETVISEDNKMEGTGDFDNDGIPNYYDFDDDGDNIPTAAELDVENADGDNNPLTNPKDTDGDGIPDYRDTDDDGDGVPTRYEDLNGDLNPANDITDNTVGPNYLNPAVAISNTVDEYRPHTYNLTTDIKLRLNNIVLTNTEEQITQESLDLGEKGNVVNGTVTITPQIEN